MTTPVCLSYAGYRFPAEVISHAVNRPGFSGGDFV